MIRIAIAIAFAFSIAAQAYATPQIAKGKPCGTCHAGSPPSKKNLK